MACPKCGEAIVANVVICPRCDYILDTSFLGDDFLNESSGLFDAVPVSSASDAVVIGGLDEEHDLMLFSESTGSFLTADTMDVERVVLPASAYVSKSVQELMKPESVLAAAPDVQKRHAAFSPFEQHVLGFIDGKRPVARLRKLTGLSSDDLRIAVGMLAEKGAIELVGTVAPPDLKALLGDLVDDDTRPVPVPIAGLFEPDAAPRDAARPAATTAPSQRGDEPRPVVQPHGARPEVNADAVAAPGTKAGASPWDVKPAASAAVPPPAPSPRSPPSPAPSPSPARSPPSAPSPPASLPRAPTPLPRTATPGPTKNQAAAFFDLAHQELQKGNRSKAHLYARLAADADPSQPKYAELLKAWGAVAKAAVTADATLLHEADAAEKAGNHQKALVLFQQAAAANPNGAHIHNRLGLLLAVRFKRYGEASECLMRAIELEPNNVVFKNNLGKIIALADERGGDVAQGKPTGLLGKLKKAFD